MIYNTIQIVRTIWWTWWCTWIESSSNNIPDILCGDFWLHEMIHSSEITESQGHRLTERASLRSKCQKKIKFSESSTVIFLDGHMRRHTLINKLLWWWGRNIWKNFFNTTADVVTYASMTWCLYEYFTDVSVCVACVLCVSVCVHRQDIYMANIITWCQLYLWYLWHCTLVSSSPWPYSQSDWMCGLRCSSVECHQVLLSLFPRYNSIS